TLINTGSVRPRDFLVWREACQLTDEGRARFFQAYEQRKATVVTHPVFGYKMSYGRMLEVQARMLACTSGQRLPNCSSFSTRHSARTSSENSGGRSRNAPPKSRTKGRATTVIWMIHSS